MFRNKFIDSINEWLDNHGFEITMAMLVFTIIFVLLMAINSPKKYREYCVNGWVTVKVKGNIIYKRDEDFKPIRCEITNQ